MHPYDGSLAKALRAQSAGINQGTRIKANLLCCGEVFLMGYPYPLHANISTVEGGLVDVAVASCGERVGIYL